MIVASVLTTSPFNVQFTNCEFVPCVATRVIVPSAVSEPDLSFTVTVPAELVAQYPGEMGIDVIWGADLGIASMSGEYISVYGSYPEQPAE